MFNFCMMQIHCRTRITRALIGLCECTDWAAPLLLAIITIRFYRATSQLFLNIGKGNYILTLFLNRFSQYLTLPCSNRPARLECLASVRSKLIAGCEQQMR